MEGSKGAKAALKEARHAIDQKDYKAALKACKKALTMDRDNYLALVFSGLCLFELGKVNDAIKVKDLDADRNDSLSFLSTPTCFSRVISWQSRRNQARQLHGKESFLCMRS